MRPPGLNVGNASVYSPLLRSITLFKPFQTNHLLLPRPGGGVVHRFAKAPSI